MIRRDNLSDLQRSHTFQLNNESLICPCVVCFTPISRCSATWTLSSGLETSGLCSKRLAGIREELHDTRHRLLKNTPPLSTSNPTTSKTTTRAPSTNQEQASEEPEASANQITTRSGVTPQVGPRPTDHTPLYLPVAHKLIKGAGTISHTKGKDQVLSNSLI